MADLLMIKSDDNSVTINLLDGTYKLVDHSWLTGTPQPSSDLEPVPYGAHAKFQSYLPQVETMDLLAKNSTHSTIRAAEQTLMQALDAARLYHQHPLWTVVATAGNLPWWLHWNIDGESEKRSLIFEGSLAAIGEACCGPFISSDGSLLRMALTRHPFWEAGELGGGGGIALEEDTFSVWGGTKFISNIPGDVWARIRLLQLYGKVANGGTLVRTWCGIREEMMGMDNFESIWELEDGGLLNGAASVWDATASDGNKVQKVNPAATLTQYVSITVDDVCTAAGHADYGDQIGEYLVLCRCKVDTGTVGLQMRYGYDQSTEMIPAEEVFITNVNWRLIELGRVSIPPDGSKPNIGSNHARYTEIEIYAEQVSGASTLDLDGLCLIPTHHFWQTDNGYITNAATSISGIETTPDDRYVDYNTYGGVPRVGLEFSTENWYLPIGDSMCVVAAERSTLHSLSDNLGSRLYYEPRWAMYRSA